jgi:hypothetical protein
MNDQRFNSLHLEASPRREEFRKARARLLGMCGQHTLMCDRDRMDEAAEVGPHTLIERPAERPVGVHFWLQDDDGIYPLKTGLNSIGRMPDNDVIMPDGSVSRRHCAILVHADDGCELHDTASKNGTFLNGQRIHGPTRLVHGDEIRMCDHKIVFQTDSTTPADVNDPARAPTIG